MQENKTKEYLKFVGVMAFISVVSVMICRTMQHDSNTEEFVRTFMGVFSVTFATFKFIGYKMFVVMFPSYDIVAKHVKSYAYAVPFIQLGLGLLFLFDQLAVTREVLMIVFAGVSSIGVSKEIYKRRAGKIHCACLGNVIKLPLSTVSFVEDFGMLILAVIMFFI